MSAADGLVPRLLFHASYWPVLALLTVGLGYRATGRRHIPTTGPLLLVANHQSFLDPWLIGNASPRWLVYLARDSLFRVPGLATAIRAYGAVPIDRGFGKEGLQTVLGQLQRGRAVLVFAEGERTHTGALQPLKPGVALLIKKARCPVVPVGLVGAYEFWPRHRPWPQPEPLFCQPEGRALAVHFAPAVAPELYAEASREVILHDLQTRIATAMHEAQKIHRRPWGYDRTR